VFVLIAQNYADSQTTNQCALALLFLSRFVTNPLTLASLGVKISRYSNEEATMPTKNVVGLFGLSNVEAISRLRDIVQDSGRVAFTNHAKLRMVQRNITRKQVIECLPRSRIIEEPHRTPRGNWKMKVEGPTIDDWIEVVLVFEINSNGDYILIVTVI